tara:strand:- start:908 stop:1015 length:108 start_codon:yes stop_codon:yes gene_type:complete
MSAIEELEWEISENQAKAKSLEPMAIQWEKFGIQN